jgi:nitrogen regulatory protein P-II 1
VKLIVAMIRPDKLEAVQEALPEPDAYIMYVSPVGDVREPILGTYRGSEYREPRPRIRLEIVVVNDVVVQEAVEVIARVACSPNLERVSNGSIFVMPLDEWVRIIPADQPRPARDADRKIYSTREAS